MMYPKAYLIKADSDDGYFEYIEIPRWMTKRERAIFDRNRKTIYASWVFAVGYNPFEIVERIFGVPR